ncbi:cytochrome P450 26A1-like [Watersipora subatra]|uniref:cytochrome P450 26A1-like n=1 Tax=Watersipora subatra TaxID=2589382 RepID=UPI00355C4E59
MQENELLTQPWEAVITDVFTSTRTTNICNKSGKPRHMVREYNAQNSTMLTETLCAILCPFALWMFCVTLWKAYIKSLKDKNSNLPLPPGSVGFPFVGETIQMMYQVLRNEELLVTTSLPESTMEIIGRHSLGASSRRDHAIRRARISKAFTSKAVQGYSVVFETMIKEWVDQACARGEVSDILKEFKQLSLQASTKTLLGLSQLSKDNEEAVMSNVAVMVDNLFTLQIPLLGSGFHKGYQIPAGWTLIYSIRDNHSAEENFDFHSEFNPDRWENVGSDLSWIPFGETGIRSCVGKIFAMTFLLQFIAISVKYSKCMIEERDPEFSYYALLIPNKALKVSVELKKLSKKTC